MLPKLKNIKINTLEELSLRLGIELDVLNDVTQHIDLHYEKFLKKIGSKERPLYEADHSLGGIHKRIEGRILDRFDFPPSMQGGIKGRSLLSNASPHVAKVNVGHFDIQNFFPSVRPSRIYRTFVKLGCAPHVSRLLTRLMTADNHLPQGFGTSTKVAALVLLVADRRLRNFLKMFGIKHTLWVDDLVVSGSYPIRKLSSGIKRILNQEGFAVHKEEITYSNKRQLVTGVVVNTKPSVQRERRKSVEATIYQCERFGVVNYIIRNRKGVTTRVFAKKVAGQLSNMLMIDREKYLPLYSRWQKLVADSGVGVLRVWN